MFHRGHLLRQLSPRRQLFFALAIVVPAAALLGIGLHTLAQERALEAQRRLDDRERVVRELEERLVAHLTTVRFDAIRELLSDLWATYPALVLAAEVRGEQLLLPGDTLRAADGVLDGGRFGELISSGETAEFARGDVDAALRSYRLAGRAAADSTQRTYVGLLEARALRKLGRYEEALLLYERLLEADAAARDEFGVPLSLYAAVALADSAHSRPKIAALVDRLLLQGQPLGHTALLTVHDLVETVGPPLEGTSPGALLERSRLALKRVEVAEQLRTALPGRLWSLPATQGQLRDTGWFALGDGPVWLLSAWETAPGTGLALVLDARAAMLAIADSDALGRAGLGDPEPATTAEDEISWVLPQVAGLHVGFAALPAPGAGNGPGERTTWFGAALTLLLGVTLMGGYLLWRDVHREAELARLRSDFVSSVSHELKTPLTAIRVHADTLILRGSDPALRRDYLDTVLSETERLNRLIDNVLAFARMERESPSYRMVTASLQDVLAGSARTMSYVLRQQGFELDVVVDPDVPPVTVDLDAMAQAVLNLLANAMKYSGESRRIELRLAREGHDAVISVTDFGFGIDEADRERIFEPFVRIDTPATRQIPGAGLGLAVVRNLVVAHGGRVRVASQPGHGSTFSIHLPIPAVA